jgi:aminoglycoside phosphotransferase (APT) family kinase protein
VVARLHRLDAPDAVRSRVLLPRLRRDAPSRLRAFGLPDHLVEQVPAFLTDAETPSVLVHGDITADHVFVDRGHLVALIDWGDAVVADRSYEIAAVFLDTFAGHRTLLDAFLGAASWPRDESFARRALQGLLEFQFNVVQHIANRVDFRSIPSLEELAQELFG